MAGKRRISVELTPDRVVFWDGQTQVGSYIYRGCWRPYFWPLCSADGNVVRGVNAREHPNQYGLAVAYGGHPTPTTTSIWSDYDEPPYGPCGKMLHEGFAELAVVDERSVVMVERTLWVNGKGLAMGADERRYRLEFTEDGEILLHLRLRVERPTDPDPGRVIWSARVADSLRVKAVYDAEGHVPGEIHGSDGSIGEEKTRGRRLQWCSYSGRLGQGHGGIALFDHPQNQDHPAEFFTREYGVFTANQEFGPHDDALSLRWGAYVFNGPAETGKIGAAYGKFVEAE